MADYTTIARPWAKAAFEYAMETNAVDAWSGFLQQAKFITRDKRVIALLQNPEIETSAKLKFLEGFFVNDISKEQKNFLSGLAEFRRLLIIPNLADLFDAQVKEHENSIDVSIVSAFPMSGEQQKKLQKALEIRLGKKVVIRLTEDRALVGGVIIHAGDLVIDSSVRSKLKRLQKVLVN